MTVVFSAPRLRVLVYKAKAFGKSDPACRNMAIWAQISKALMG
jgi:hypothetical protein